MGGDEKKEEGSITEIRNKFRQTNVVVSISVTRYQGGKYGWSHSVETNDPAVAMNLIQDVEDDLRTIFQVGDPEEKKPAKAAKKVEKKELPEEKK